MKAHLGVERQAVMGRAMGRVGLNEFVVEKDSWFRNKVEHFVGVRDVWDFKKLAYQEFAEVRAIFKSVGVYLLQLVHNRVDLYHQSKQS